MADLNGKDYRAKVRLSGDDDLTLADVGETCDRVPAASLGWLLEQHLIEPIVLEVTTMSDPEGVLGNAIAPVETAVAAPVETRAEGDA